MFCRKILMHNDLLDLDMTTIKGSFQHAVRENVPECAKPIAWRIIQLFGQTVTDCIQHFIDIWPAVICKCHKDSSGMCCSTELVIAVEVRMINTDFPKEFKGIKIQYIENKIHSEEPKQITCIKESFIQLCKSENGGNLHLDASKAKILFEQHSRLNIISTSLVKSSGFPKSHVTKNQPCIQLFCTVKGLIPVGESHFPRYISDIEIDVLEGSSRLCVKKLQIGDAIGTDGGGGGTLGGFIKHLGRVLFLTCAHVVLPRDILLGSSSRQHLLDEIEICKFNTSPSDELIDPTPCGRLDNFVFKTGNHSEISVDAALVEIRTNTHGIDETVMLNVPETVGSDRTFRCLGMGSPYLNSNFLDLEDIGTYFTCGVKSVGCVSKYQKKETAIVKVAEKTIEFEKLLNTHDRCFPLNDGVHVRTRVRELGEREVKHPRYCIFYNQMALGNVAFQQGDSGTCIYVTESITKRRGCLGMAIASHPNGGCIVTPIKAILSALNLI